MATVVLQTIGAAVGSSVGGPFGAIVGRAAGALAGSAIDQKLFSKDRIIEGSRLENAQVLTSNIGAPIPKAYGFNRLAGEIIWATRFEEVVSSSSQSAGGKGGGNQVTTTRFSYFANFAVGICEGPISGIKRAWADNEELDLTKIEYRFYNGNEEQLPDPLIEAKQGSGNTPAYRGLAYIVFEGLPLEKYGNRVPQLSFEIIKSIGVLEAQIKSITVIPGSTEYGYDPIMIESGGGDSPFSAHNRHVSIAETDWQASINELQMLCPNLESVSLVVTWFGTDLRAGNCNLLPGITSGIGPNWRVGNYTRFNGYQVSKVDDRPAFGGTPTDASILRAIADLKARGLKVVLYPFIMMDIPQGNDLPALHGEANQPTYPWRGEISCFPGAGEINTVDKTSVARDQLNQFSAKYNAFIRHYISLSEQAGGINGFLIGSELRGLTRVRDGNGAFPFVETLMTLADEAKSSLGSDCFVTYGADWSEYFGYQPQDGSNDVLYNLDPLWALSSIDAIGIDNYMPLADWRDEGDPENTNIKTPYSVDYLKSNIAANEGYDWFYKSNEDRQNAVRTPITDGQGEPWIYRYKDIVSWWSRPHHERHAGIRNNNSTAWMPQSKPIYLTELGCPAIDKGANQPNVFFDPKSDQSAIPYFSSGGRDDLIQRRFLEAYYAYWADEENNPSSENYVGSMLAVETITPWAWDARPFPWFPLDLSVWSDGSNWHTGHWLNGRLGACSLQELVIQILHEFGIDNVDCQLDGYLEGYVIPSQASAREALEPLLQFFNVNVIEEQGRIIFTQAAYAKKTSIITDDVVQENDQPKVINTRDSELELPSEVIIEHATVFSDYEQLATKSRRLDGGSSRQISIQLPIVIPETMALKKAEEQLRRDWIKRETRKISISNRYFQLSPGDLISFDGTDEEKWLVKAKDTNILHELDLEYFQDFPVAISAQTIPNPGFSSFISFGQPSVDLMDLPLLRSADEAKTILHIAAHAKPWAGRYAVFSSPSQDGFKPRTIIDTQAITGVLLMDVEEGVLGRFDQSNQLHVQLLHSSLQSADILAVLNGANLIAVEANNGEFELLQFQSAELQPDGSWILSNLLRAQFGTDDAMKSGLPNNSKVIIIDDRLAALELETIDIGFEQNWRIGPAEEPIGAENYLSQTHLHNKLSAKMFRPVHLRAKVGQDENIEFSWIRRGRIDSDSWENAEIPLDANSENYLVDICDATGTLRRQIDLSHNHFTYLKANRLADLGAESGEFLFKVAQVGNNGLPGSQASMTVNLQSRN